VAAGTVETTTGWTGGNTGPWANFQYPIFGQSNRRTPDLSFDADPASGAWVYSGFGMGGWGVVGGTSLSSPALAGIVNRLGNKLGSVFLTPATSGGDWFSTWENNMLYSQLAAAKAYKATSRRQDRVNGSRRWRRGTLHGSRQSARPQR
jgi:hypothetical protein